MKSKIIALKWMIGLLLVVILFYLYVLFEIISYKIVWAGKLNSKEEMYVFEALSILINFVLDNCEEEQNLARTLYDSLGLAREHAVFHYLEFLGKCRLYF